LDVQKEKNSKNSSWWKGGGGGEDDICYMTILLHAGEKANKIKSMYHLAATTLLQYIYTYIYIGSIF